MKYLYQAIYRRYRPKTFDELIGQDDITNVIKNQVDQGKISHAYLFTGTRGTGKTSCAKVMARAVNCLNPQNGNPCNECANCRSIIDETTLDVVEMDAASNRRIDDIRELKDQVIFPPASLKYKVYIIDEAHMITKEGFNALLKIMEEPPKHLIFILATTEIDKIPQTILSRCQRFDFKRIGLEDIERSLSHIAKDLGRDIDEEAIEVIARAADGALRDGQSLLDQVLASSQGPIDRAMAYQAIGGLDQDRTFDLVDKIRARDEGGLAQLANEALKETSPDELLAGLIDHYRDLLLAKTTGQVPGEKDDEAKDAILDQAKAFDLGQLADGLELLMDWEERLRLSSSPASIAFIAIFSLYRLDSRDNLVSRIENLERKLEAMEAGRFRPQLSQENISYDRPDSTYEIPEPSYEDLEAGPWESLPDSEENQIEEADKDPGLGQEPAKARENTALNENGLNLFKDWSNMVDEILRLRPMWGLWLNDLRPGNFEDGQLEILIEPGEKTKAHQARQAREDLEYEISTYLGQDLNIVIKEEKLVADKALAKEKDPEEEKINKLKEIFGDKLEIQEEE